MHSTHTPPRLPLSTSLYLTVYIIMNYLKIQQMVGNVKYSCLSHNTRYTDLHPTAAC